MMTKIGNMAGRKTRAVISNMDEPLGRYIGNSLEVIEAINFLKGDMHEDLKEVILEIGANMIRLAGKGDNIEANKLKLLENIENGNLSLYSCVSCVDIPNLFFVSRLSVVV